MPPKPRRPPRRRRCSLPRSKEACCGGDGGGGVSKEAKAAENETAAFGEAEVTRGAKVRGASTRRPVSQSAARSAKRLNTLALYNCPDL